MDQLAQILEAALSFPVPPGNWLCVGPHSAQDQETLENFSRHRSISKHLARPVFVETANALPPPCAKKPWGLLWIEHSPDTPASLERCLRQARDLLPERGILALIDSQPSTVDAMLEIFSGQRMVVFCRAEVATPAGTRRLTLCHRTDRSLSCQVCLEDTSVFAESDPPFALLKCPACGSMRLAPFLTDEELSSYYQQEYRTREEGQRFPRWIESGIRAFRNQRVRRIFSVTGPQPKRLLDVGCGRGAMLRELKLRGWNVSGTELNRDACGALAAEGIRMHEGTLETFPPDEKFDVITLFHVLEHCPDLASVWDRIEALTSDTAHLVIEIPNGTCWLHRLAGNRFLARDLPYHQHQINPSALARTLGKRRWNLLRYEQWSLEHGPFTFAQTLANLAWFQVPNALFRALQESPLTPNLRRAALIQAPFFAVALAIYPFWFLLSAPARNSEITRLWLRKEESPS